MCFTLMSLIVANGCNLNSVVFKKYDKIPFSSNMCFTFIFSAIKSINVM